METTHSRLGSGIQIAGFNEATLFQAWKLDRKPTQCGIGICASMRPRFFRRGNMRKASGRLSRYTSFNEATLFQAWKRRHAVGFCVPNTGFNEATLFQAWKLYLKPNEVQCVPASMRPRFFRRGNNLRG